MFETLFPRSDNFLTRFQIKEKQEYEKKKKTIQDSYMENSRLVAGDCKVPFDIFGFKRSNQRLKFQNRFIFASIKKHEVSESRVIWNMRPRLKRV